MSPSTNVRRLGIYFLLLSLGMAHAQERSIVQEIERLADNETSAEALEALVSHGEDAVPELLGEAWEGSELSTRGWAIVCLSQIGGSQAQESLAKLFKDRDQPELVRTWAAAACVQLAPDSEALLDLVALSQTFPALTRPLGMRLSEALTGESSAGELARVLKISYTFPELQPALAPAILAQGADALCLLMRTGSSNELRWQATAYLGTLAIQGDATVPAAVAETYSFDPQAKQVPWHGGALYVPGVSYTEESARKLCGNLVRWHLWCERFGKPEEQNQIHNNLRSLELARMAGYDSPAWEDIGTDGWLLLWGKTMGKTELRAILEQQNVHQAVRYQNILASLP